MPKAHLFCKINSIKNNLKAFIDLLAWNNSKHPIQYFLNLFSGARHFTDVGDISVD